MTTLLLYITTIIGYLYNYSFYRYVNNTMTTLFTFYFGRICRRFTSNTRYFQSSLTFIIFANSFVLQAPVSASKFPVYDIRFLPLLA